MPRRPASLLGGLALAALLAAPARAQGGEIVHDTVRSAARRGNLLGDSPDRHVAVYLPPGYAASRGRYPVVYLLHGFDAHPRQWTETFDVRQALDSLLAAGAVRPMLVVMPDEHNAFGGSFYANSTVSGRWEDFTAGDLVRHVDSLYRTLPRPESRAVAGWSMGGFGALHLAGAHPDVFGAAYALSPCCMGPEQIDDVWRSGEAWKTTLALRGLPGNDAGFGTRLQLALAALLSPAPDAPPPHVRFPFAARGDTLAPVDSVLWLWRQEDPYSFVREHAWGLRRLRGLAFDAGAADGFRHIPATTAELSSALTAVGIAHTFEPYQGTHGSHVRERLRTRVLPFLSARLAGAETPSSPPDSSADDH